MTYFIVKSRLGCLDKLRILAYSFIYPNVLDGLNPMTDRFLEFCVYISDTPNKENGSLCFRDTEWSRDTIPNPVNITCNQAGTSSTTTTGHIRHSRLVTMSTPSMTCVKFKCMVRLSLKWNVNAYTSLKDYSKRTDLSQILGFGYQAASMVNS